MKNVHRICILDGRAFAASLLLFGVENWGRVLSSVDQHVAYYGLGGKGCGFWSP